MTIDGPRGTRPEEFTEVLALVNWVFRESRGRPPMMGEAYPLLFHPDNLENLQVLFVDGQPVSHIGIVQREVVILGCRIRIGSVGSVGTHPDHQKKGYATRLLRGCVEKLRRDGVDVMLISGGRGLYRRNGCVPAGKVYTFTVSRGDAHRFRASAVKVLPYEKERLSDVTAVYQREPIRFLRSVEDFRALLGTAEVLTRLGRERRVLCCVSNGDLLAYAVVTVRSDENRRIGAVTEYAGERRVLAEAMPAIFDAMTLDALTLKVLPSDLEMYHLLRGNGLDPVSGNIDGHTLRIVNFPAMMEKFRGYLSERVGRRIGEALTFREENDRRIMELRGDRFVVDGEDDLGRIIFDTGVDETDVSGKIDEVLKDLLPLPFVTPGLNFV